ncbi:MAG TPA: NAD-dependent epimerase/dehydratase family protein, partial [Flavobacterium sp.]|nr:NAD-dependent epimerase/dehydratase family protein [Flavobacterium sp.]
MKILITGAAGYIGSHVAERLQSIGNEVVGLDNFSDYYDVSLKEMNASVLKIKGIKIEKIQFYKKPLDQAADPRFHSVEVSLVPSTNFPHVKQIIFVEPDPIKNK